MLGVRLVVVRTSLQASDPKHRCRYFIQWRGNVLAHRVWLECPSDKELVEPKWKWKSIREPTASEPGGSTQDIKQEAKEEEAEEQETPAPRSKRSTRAQRQFEMRETYRVWVDTLEEVAEEHKLKSILFGVPIVSR